MQDRLTRVLFVGGLSTGKSSLINALLGDDVLPVDVVPCTAVISEVVYGEEKGAALHFKDSLQLSSPYADDRIRKHLESVRMNIPPVEIGLEELRNCITLPKDSMLQEDSLFNDMKYVESPYSRAVIRYPSEFLRSGFELIDTPGLNDDTSRDEFTLKYLMDADAVVLCSGIRKCLV